MTHFRMAISKLRGDFGHAQTSDITYASKFMPLVRSNAKLLEVFPIIICEANPKNSFGT